MRIPALLALVVLLAGCTSDMETASVTIDGLEDPIAGSLEFEPGSRPTEHLYQANGGDHPGFYSAHDLLYDFGLLYGVEFEFTYFDESWGSGFFLSTIDNEPGPGENRFWQVSVNGEASMVGISEIEIQPGDEVGLSLQSF